MVMLDTNPPVMLLAHFSASYPGLSISWMLPAPERTVWVAGALAHGDSFTIVAPDLDSRAVFDLISARHKNTLRARPLPRWARYPAAVALQLEQRGLNLCGANMVVMGTEPSGPRYEHAIGMAFAAFWHEVYGMPCDAPSLVDLVDQAQREYAAERV
jgi:galactokinase